MEDIWKMILWISKMLSIIWMYVRRFIYHLRARPFNVCEFEFCPNVKGFDILWLYFGLKVYWKWNIRYWIVGTLLLNFYNFSGNTVNPKLYGEHLLEVAFLGNFTLKVPFSVGFLLGSGQISCKVVNFIFSVVFWICLHGSLLFLRFWCL